jgi:predicted MPP superfamily phosphohydrolase
MLPLKPAQFSRRRFLKLSAASVATLGLGGLGYGFAVRKHVQLSRVEVKLAHLPGEFDGLTIAHLSDLHLGIYTSADYLRHCVELTNAQRPDIVALTGDYTYIERKYVEPCADILSELRPRVGSYAILGNHDYYQGAGHTARAMRRVKINMLIDKRDRLEARGAKLSLFGVDDLYYGDTDVVRLLREVPEHEPRLVLAHNPDFIERFARRNQHVDLMMSGHTHGGQIRFPLVGAPHIDSSYGQRYARGLNRCREMQIYTTRGVGMVGLPVRFDCPPEVVLYTLRQA